MEEGDADLMDLAAFHSWVCTQERRYELVEGRPRLLPLETAFHSRISMNVMRWLITSLDRNRYDLCSCQLAIETGERTVRFADGTVMPFADDESSFSADRALFIYEIASPEILQLDLGPKRAEYATLPNLVQYLVASEEAPRVLSWSRDDGWNWPSEPETVSGMSGMVRLAPFGLSMSLAEVYDRVSFGSDA